MIKIVIAEDQGMLRGALGILLDLEEDFEVIGQATNGAEALLMIDEKQPDLCIVDIEMPVLSGLDVAEKLKEQNHPCRVMVLTTFARPGYFQRAMKAGVYGYLLKDGPSDELAHYIRKVMEGKRIISPELSFAVWEDTNPLSERELEVLKLAKSGKTSKEIAKTLFLSDGTIRNYLSEVFRKLDAKNKIEAIGIAENKGWLKE
ncbi:response regulator transcription factor [Bacillus salitolerans]|uniref:Response regulator transcription factor n=1 Tax=Bacillus salitolerans TaxID=1437434 RepID=A0ABW4LWV3_9BACI